MAYEVPQLPYAYDALEPHIDEATMRVHHDKHHQAYVDKANAALEGTEWADKSVEEVLKNLDSLPSDKQKAVRNNGGGHYNHSLFWEWMSPDGGGEPSGALAEASTSGSTRTTSSTRTSARTTSTPGGTSSTGTRSPRGTPRSPDRSLQRHTLALSRVCAAFVTTSASRAGTRPRGGMLWPCHRVHFPPTIAPPTMRGEKRTL
jgi:iron/manganese superoxide dismutase-like protein